jgi:hypothetical protein
MGYPSVFPTGTTVYYPEKCWNGYTIYPAIGVGGVLVDMNGNISNIWEGLHGMPNKILPGGYVMGCTGLRNPKYGHQDHKDLVQVDWDGNTVWKFDKYEYIEDPGEEPQWMARQHHDFQREGNPVNYYVPGMDPLVDKGNTIILCHKIVKNPKITDKGLIDDTIIEVTWEGDIVWEWICSDHFDEMGFSEDAKNTLYRNPSTGPPDAKDPDPNADADWNHINSVSLLGPNKWHDAGDERFHPENIIWSARHTNIIAIIDKKNGNLVWRLGPEFNATPELRKMKQIIGQHHPHMIPRGLPGAGNILVFDNGGQAGYGPPNPCAPKGVFYARRDFSRVLEFDPTSLEIVWQYTPHEAGFLPPGRNDGFYSSFISSAQRMPNGNTLITEGAYGRLLEVTPEHELVWEYINPYFTQRNNSNSVYRAYRVPYEWIPQLEKPEEKALPRIDNSKLRLGHLLGGPAQGEDPVRTTKIKEGVDGFDQPIQECIESDALDGD